MDIDGRSVNRGGDRYGYFHVDQIRDTRWDAARAHFAEGGRMAYGGVGLVLDGGTVVIQPFWTEDRPPTSVEIERAYDRAFDCLAFLQQQDPDFARLVVGHELRAELLKDEGMGLYRLDTRDMGDIPRSS